MNNPYLIVALDVPNKKRMIEVLSKMPDSVSWYKIGLELFTAEGPSILEVLKNMNKSIFLDLKLHDIPKTVSNTVKVISDYDVDLITVHSLGGRTMLESAVSAAKNISNAPKIVSVTTLTSINQNDLVNIGIEKSLSDQALSLAQMSIDAGIDGLVTSAHEACTLKNHFPDSLLVTPGIRFSNDNDDQKRVSTPRFAAEQGSTHIVIGRPILNANNPSKVVEKIYNDLASRDSNEA